LIIGSTVFLPSFLLKATKKEWLKKVESVMGKVIDDTKNQEDDPFVKGLKSYGSSKPSIKVSGSKGEQKEMLKEQLIDP
jgi:hypothetical protein